MTRLTSILLSFAILGSTAADPAYAQPGPSADRIATGIAIRPLLTGGHRVEAVMRLVSDDDFTVPTSVATDVLLLVNGSAPTAPNSHDLFFTSCTGSADCPLGQTCLCWDDVCQCEGGSITSAFDVVLLPGDLVEVHLLVGAGGLPEEDSTNNTRSVVFQGESIVWDRRLVSAELVPVPGAPDLYDIVLDAEIAANLDGLHALGATFEVFIDGDHAGSFPGPFFDDLFWSPCATVACDDTVACVMDAAGGFFGTCQPSGSVPACQCLYHPVPNVIPGLLIAPDTTEIEIVLERGYGALPELSELPGEPPTDNDRLTVAGPSQPCAADVDQDGTVGFGDLLAILAAWGPCIGCPEDIDNDNIVGFTDLLIVLAAWGSC